MHLNLEFAKEEPNPPRSITQLLNKITALNLLLTAYPPSTQNFHGIYFARGKGHEGERNDSIIEVLTKTKMLMTSYLTNKHSKERLVGTLIFTLHLHLYIFITLIWDIYLFIKTMKIIVFSFLYILFFDQILVGRI